MPTQAMCDTIRPVDQSVRDVGLSGEVVELTMTFVVGSDPIQGSTRVAGGERREFWGWLELAEIVQNTVDAGRAANGDRASTPVKGAASR